MTTVFVAAEKLMNWASDGSMLINKTTASVLASHSKHNRLIVYFAPSRFGLCFDSRKETEEAWHYMQASLKLAGFEPQDVILFEEDADVSSFKRVIKTLDEEEAVILFSDEATDAGLSEALGIRLVEEIPSNISSLWQRINLRHAFKALFAAIQA